MAARRRDELLEIGSSAPEFRLELLAGGAASLTEILTRGPVLLAFFKISCPVCQLTFPYLERLHAAGLQVYGVSQNDAEDTGEFNRAFGVTFPTLLDPEEKDFPVSNDYGISSVPTLYRIEPGGAVAQAMEGWRKREMETLSAQQGYTLLRPGEYLPEWKAG
jgi:peroxiredoxin